MKEVFCKTVWLIDDDNLSNFINRAILNLKGFAQSIVTFTTAQEALNSLNQATPGDTDFPEIIFLDMEMPGMNGWDFMEAFCQLPGTLKEKCCIYMLSSSVNEADALKAKQYEEICDFIEKPLTVEELISIKTSVVCTKPGK